MRRWRRRPDGRPDPRRIDHVTIDVASTSAEIRVHPADGLEPGTYTGTLVMQACYDELCQRHVPGSPHNVAYRITVRDNFRVSPRLVLLSGDRTQVTSQQLTVTPPAGISDFNIAVQDDWATVTRESPSILRVSAGPRPRGLHSSRITLQAGAYTRELGVSYNALPRSLRLSASRIDLAATSGGAPQADIVVEQLAEDATGFSVGLGATSPGQRLGLQRPSWNPAVDVSVSPTLPSWVRTQVLPDGDIEVSASAGSMAAGATYAAELRLTPADPGEPIVIPVTMTVGPGLAIPRRRRCAS